MVDRIRVDHRHVALLTLLAALAGCGQSAETNPSTIANDLCTQVNDSSSLVEKEVLVTEFLAANEDFADGLFDTATLTEMIDKSLREGMDPGREPISDIERIAECSEFLMAHWLAK